MRPNRLIVLLLILLPTIAMAQKKPKKPDLSAVFATARYIYVESMDGDAFKPGLYPGDRQAIADVEDALRQWNRYALAVRREEAELVIVVRKGRLASSRLHGGIGGGTGPQAPQIPGQQNPRGTTMGTETEVGPVEDLLKVYMLTSDGQLGAQIWTRSLDDGLNAPQLALFRQFRAAVERAYPSVPASQPSKP
jgi:hypothetical protein